MKWSNKSSRKKQTSTPKAKPKSKPASLPTVPQAGPKPFIPPFQSSPQQGWAPAIQQIPQMPKKPEPVKFESPFIKKQPDIPPIERKKEHSEYQKEFLACVRQLTGKWTAYDIWHDFVLMSACGISNVFDSAHYEARAKRFIQTTEKYSKEEFRVFADMFGIMADALEANPEQDFLGDIYTELGLNSKELKQEFTPYPVAQLMSQIVLPDAAVKVEEKGSFSVMDPSCGTGATLIALINEARVQLEKAGYNFQNHVMVMGQDIDENVALACYVELSLLGAAGFCKVGDSLADPMTEGDELDNYWFTPGYFFPVWQWRRIFRALDALTALEDGKTDTSDR